MNKNQDPRFNQLTTLQTCKNHLKKIEMERGKELIHFTIFFTEQNW